MSKNRSGETTLELATQSLKSFVFLHQFKRFWQLNVFTGRSPALVQMHSKTNTINSKLTLLQVAYKNPQSVRYWFKCNLF